MKRLAPILLCLAGLAVLFVLMPQFNAAQPRGVQITRGEAKAIADAQATRLGIPVDKAWSNLTWVGSPHLDRELERDPERRRRAADDPTIGPRLGGYHISYYRRGQEKFPPYGYVYVSGAGELLASRLYSRAETPGANLPEAEIRKLSDAFVRSRKFAGAPSPEFESARPNVLRTRTDWTLRYRVKTDAPVGNVVPYLMTYYVGSRFAGWALIEEYADGTPFKGDSASQLAGQFVRFGAIFVMLLILLIIFLKKYHAGEVGVRTASGVFAVTLVLLVIFDMIISPAVSEGSNFGSVDAPWTSWAIFGFKFLFLDIPIAMLAFFGWAVGESYARERWGERLASFDALLNRDAFNATVGRSLLNGALLAPAVAAAAYLVGFVALQTRLATPALGGGSELVLYLGGLSCVIVVALANAIVYPITAVLFPLAFSSRKRVLWAGIAAALVLGAVAIIIPVPIEPNLHRMLFGFGAIAAVIGVFLAYDLLTSSIALFFGSLIGTLMPLLTVAEGNLSKQIWLTMLVPLGATLAFAAAALMTRREVIYSYEDLAPHVRRIIERERVKAEIDAANRIQAALLPLDTPSLAGASVASHYRAATEIGGDYFDFLPQPTGEIGIAFGDVSGHGLTSGIVMAMAKAALLVQVDYDASPRSVLTVLNEVVMKTAPRRMLMTFFFGLLDSRTQTLRFSSAGHHDPYVFRAATKKIEALSSWGFPLGVRRREPFTEHTVEFDAGDRLILYSDGLIEAVDDDGEPFGFERFEKVVRDAGQGSAEDIKKQILTSVKKFTRNRPPEDDQTLVVVSFDEAAVAMLGRPSVQQAMGETVH